jgi:capsular polysaccharide transport system permease protein
MESARVAIDRALALAPENAEYHLHRAHLLFGLGDFAGAADAFTRAVAIDPGSRAGKQAQLGALVADGRLAEATAAGGELLRVFPDDIGTAEVVLQVLNRRLDTIEAEYVIVTERAGRPSRRPRPPSGFVEKIRRQARVVHALILRETRTRFGESRLGYAWALLEPVLHIAMLSAVFSLLMRGRPPIGTQFFIFYYTGLVPYLAFVHTSTAMTHAITSNGSLLQLPLITNFDVIVARGLLEFVTDVVVAVLLLAGFAAAGMPALPDDIGGAASALIAAALLGCGVGFVNAVVQVLFKSWDKLWTNATRLLYFFSGIFYVPGMMPDWARDILVWNPVLQAVEWFRASFFAVYRPHWLDRSYLVVAAILAMAVGLALERGLRRRLREPL